ncbi:hypothetical protein FB451DRAFT_678781 [Mycena latifolia]|nr:hypothetical protein FB451DRAFT_678781 [Mycena latifolia]
MHTSLNLSQSAADELLRKDRGGCKLDTAQVCLRLTGDMNRPNFVLAHFDPSHFYEPTANDRDIVANGWDIFVNLITKAITGNRSKPNYVTGSHGLSLIVLAFYSFLHRIPGATGPTVTRVFRFLIHFLIDFRYHPERQHNGLNQTFRKLSSEIKSLESDIESLDSSSNPLLDSMQRYSSSLCAIWDLWEVIPATPGDLGIMIPGDDPRRPRFKRIVNLTVNIQAWLSELGQAPPMVTSYPEYAEQLEADISFNTSIKGIRCDLEVLQSQNPPCSSFRVLGESLSWAIHGTITLRGVIFVTFSILGNFPLWQLSTTSIPRTSFSFSPVHRAKVTLTS